MLVSWSNFFTLTGSAGATLLGLLFVVATLGTNLTTSRKLDIAHASMTPALYSFTDVLLQSLIVQVPWTSNWQGGGMLILLACWGILYRINRVWARKKLHLRAINGVVDRIFHNAVPVVASIILLVGGVGLIRESAFSPFAIAASSILLLISGIYRSWGETLALIGTPDKP